MQALERAALEREERSRVEREAQAAEVARQEAEREAAVRREEEERKATAAAEVERLKAKHEAALKREEEERKPNTAAEHDAPSALPPEEREGQTNAELVRSAQTQLARLGCFDGGLDGNLNTATKTAVARYQMLRGQPTGEIEITDDFVLELANQSTRVCPLVCPAGQVAEGEVCVATQTEPASRPKDVGEGQRRLKARLDEVKAEAKTNGCKAARTGRRRSTGLSAASGRGKKSQSLPRASPVVAMTPRQQRSKGEADRLGVDCDRNCAPREERKARVGGRGCAVGLPPTAATHVVEAYAQFLSR